MITRKHPAIRIGRAWASKRIDNKHRLVEITQLDTGRGAEFVTVRDLAFDEFGKKMKRAPRDISLSELDSQYGAVRKWEVDEAFRIYQDHNLKAAYDHLMFNANLPYDSDKGRTRKIVNAARKGDAKAMQKLGLLPQASEDLPAPAETPEPAPTTLFHESREILLQTQALLEETREMVKGVRDLLATFRDEEKPQNEEKFINNVTPMIPLPPGPVR